MKSLARSVRQFAVALLGVALLGSCASNSSALKEVHQTYQSEFQSQLAKPSAEAAAPSSFNAQQFPATLAAISKFRQEHPSLDAANKHLTVLEALVYLQTTRYGQARLAAKAASAMPGSLSTYGGGLTRDELLLQAMIEDPGLIGGWRFLTGGKIGNPDNIDSTAKRLAEISAMPQSRVANVDEGRIYLAAVSAMLWRKRGLMKMNAGMDRVKTMRTYGPEMVRVLGPCLTPQERDADKADAEAISQWSLRYRYVQLYQIGKDWADAKEGD